MKMLEKIQPSLVAVIIMAAVFILSIFFGLNSGKNLAASQRVATDAGEISRGLEYFYSDHGRFPDLQEFLDNNVQLRYFSSAIENKSKTGGCRENFVYKRTALKTYELNFCLSSGVLGYRQGWNKITANKN